ncbi:hypothetical protein T459_01610 [Capsicum annuum]|uniref:Uncharacterized protein n=1 Tax=Capsicum annuum TaxID=4072 RepID=A0A2G3AHR4_CAPAN|nr:hypothetical protein T459_01610 [Capsicum annuum]
MRRRNAEMPGSRIQIFIAEDNSDELESPVTSVKNDSTTEDNTDELISPVTSVKNDSMAEDNINELVSPVTTVKNDSSGSKPDKISTIKLRSMSNGNKVPPCYRNSSSTSSYNAGNTRRQSTGKLNSPDSEQDIHPHYLRASTGSCHGFCKYGRKHSSESKQSHGILYQKERTNFLLMSRVLLGPWWEMQKRGLWSSKNLPILPGVCWERKRR